MTSLNQSECIILEQRPYQVSPVVDEAQGSRDGDGVVDVYGLRRDVGEWNVG